MMRRYNKYSIFEFVPVASSEDCSICKNMNTFLANKAEQPISIVNLAEGNLKRHLSTGKHWKCVKYIDRADNKEFNVQY